MIRLDRRTKKLQAFLGGAVAATQPTVVVCYSDRANPYGPASKWATKLTTMANTTVVDICPSPNAVTVREVDSVNIRNNDSATATVTVRLYDGGATYRLVVAALATGEMLCYEHGVGWYVLLVAGGLKTLISSAAIPWDSPGAIGSVTPAAGTFTSLAHGSATLVTTTVALTNGAAAAAGTLLNAPAAGNPTKWVPINDNGTTRYIPAW